VEPGPSLQRIRLREWPDGNNMLRSRAASRVTLARSPQKPWPVLVAQQCCTARAGSGSLAPGQLLYRVSGPFIYPAGCDAPDFAFGESAALGRRTVPPFLRLDHHASCPSPPPALDSRERRRVRQHDGSGIEESSRKFGIDSCCNDFQHTGEWCPDRRRVAWKFIRNGRRRLRRSLRM
jgi:hypothetical protein